MKQLTIVRSFFTLLPNAAYMQLQDTIISSAMEGRVDTIDALKPSFASYKAAFKYADDVYKKQQKYLETEDLLNLDNERDHGFSAIKQAADAAVKSLNPTVKQAAREVSNIFHKYKKCTSLGHEKETAEIKNLMEDLLTPEMEANLVKLDLLEAVKSLQTVNLNYETLYNERSIKKQSELDKGTMLAAREAVDNAYTTLQDFINGLYVQNEVETKDPERKKVLEEVITLVTGFVNQTKKTGKRKKSDGDGGGDTPEPGPKPVLTPIVHITSQNVRNPVADPAGAAKLMTANVAE
jgi:hypothetical protein